jgi:sporulation protein YlmC with PRC-barrel domain
VKVSEIYNMDIYSDSGQYLGEVKDAIVDLERGEVSRLLMEEWRNATEEDIRRILQHKSVLFRNIKNISDVVLVSSGTGAKQAASSSNSAEVSDLMGR